MSLTDYLDLLRNATNAECMLRQQASIEWANNMQGPMTQAHKASIANVISAAKQLIECEVNEAKQTAHD